MNRKGSGCQSSALDGALTAGRRGQFCSRRRLFPIVAGWKEVAVLSAVRGDGESGEQKGAVMRAVEGHGYGYNGGGR